MSDAKPTAAQETPALIVDTLDNCDVEILREIADYVEELTEYRECEARLHNAGEDEAGEAKERPEDLPDDVPTKATFTVKEINDNRYYYWQ